MRHAVVLLLLLPLASAAPLALPQNEPPFVDFAWSPSAPAAGDEVSFHSYSGNTDGILVLHEWTFGDGEVLALPSGQSVTRRYERPGLYLVELRVTDQLFATANLSRVLTVLGRAPTVRLEASDGAPYRGEVVSFRAEDVGGDESSIVNWSWDFGDGAVSFAREPQHAFRALGAHVVSATVTDVTGLQGTASVVIDVQNAPPVVGSWGADRRTGSTSDTFTFFVDAIDPDGADTLSCRWRFTDGHVAEGQVVSRAFPRAGIDRASVEVADADGATTMRAVRVLVRPAEE